MKTNILDITIRHFQQVLTDIDFNNLPEKDDENYRDFMLKSADNLYSEGRYSQKTEWTLELFDRDDVLAALKDLKMINALTDLQRAQLRFCLAMRDICYPLFRGQKVDWTSWPWNMKDGRSTMYNKELCKFITEGGYPYLGAAICYDLKEYRWDVNEDELFTSIAMNEMSEKYFYEVEKSWGDKKDKEVLIAELVKFTDDMRDTENHFLVGRRLGMDYMAQAVYDAVDGFICDTYYYNQVDFAKELGEWLEDNWSYGEENPDKEKFYVLENKIDELMEKYDVHCSDYKHMWNVLLLDELKVLYSGDDTDDDDDDDDWLLDDLLPYDQKKDE